MSSPDEKSSALKGLELIPLDEQVDQIMDRVPRTSIDFSDETRRAQLRLWLRAMAVDLVRHAAEQFTDASRRSIQEVSRLIADPEFHASRQKRLAASRQRRAAAKQQEPADPEPLATSKLVVTLRQAEPPRPKFRRK